MMIRPTYLLSVRVMMKFTDFSFNMELMVLSLNFQINAKEYSILNQPSIRLMWNK